MLRAAVIVSYYVNAAAAFCSCCLKQKNGGQLIRSFVSARQPEKRYVVAVVITRAPSEGWGHGAAHQSCKRDDFCRPEPGLNPKVKARTQSEPEFVSNPKSDQKKRNLSVSLKTNPLPIIAKGRKINIFSESFHVPLCLAGI